jgi:hypothetical protein
MHCRRYTEGPWNPSPSSLGLVCLLALHCMVCSCVGMGNELHVVSYASVDGTNPHPIGIESHGTAARIQGNGSFCGAWGIVCA